MSQLKVIRRRQERRRRTFMVSIFGDVLLGIYLIYRVITADPAPTADTILKGLGLYLLAVVLGLVMSLPSRYLTRRGEKAVLDEAARKKQAWREKQNAKKKRLKG